MLKEKTGDINNRASPGIL